jgi:hypothetical protein
MQRRNLCAVISLSYAFYWAALQWPWIRHAGHVSAKHGYGWWVCALFVLLSLALATGWHWARLVGLVASGATAALRAVALIGAYFLSFFGDQAIQLDFVCVFLGAIAFPVTLVVLLSRPLDTDISLPRI